MKVFVISLLFLSMVFLSGCSKEDEFSCTQDGQLNYNGTKSCAEAFVPRHEIQETGTVYEDLTLTISTPGAGVGLTIYVLTTGEIFEVNKAYTWDQAVITPEAYYTATFDVQTYGSFSVTFTKLDRTNNIMSGTFNLQASIIGVGGPEQLTLSGSFTDVPYYD
jgi:hypothetical protein